MRGYCTKVNVFTRWPTQYTKREHAKHVLKARFYSNHFACYSGTDTQGLFQTFDLHVDSSIWFRYQIIIIVHGIA